MSLLVLKALQWELGAASVVPVSAMSEDEKVESQCRASLQLAIIFEVLDNGGSEIDWKKDLV